MTAPIKKAPPLGKLPTSGNSERTQSKGKAGGVVPVAGPGSSAGIPGSAPATAAIDLTGLDDEFFDNKPTPTAPAAVAPPLATVIPGEASVPATPVSGGMINEIINSSQDPFAVPKIGQSGSVAQGDSNIVINDNGGQNATPTIKAPTNERGVATPGTGVTFDFNTPQFQWSDGESEVQYAQRARQLQIQELAPAMTAPIMQPALQWNPQALDPSVTGGVTPKAEDNNPFSWLMGDNKGGDLNPFQGKFANSSGILGAVGYAFGRVPGVVMGAASDVARSVAGVGDGFNNAASSGGNFGDKFKQFTQGYSNSVEANSPENRGSPIKTVFGNRDLASAINSSYTLAGLVGTNDLSFSGVGNRGAGRYVIVNNQFNPFGFQNPFGELKTNYTDKKTGQTKYLTPDGAKYGLSNTWLMWGGIVADVVVGGKIDKAVVKLLPAPLKFLAGGAAKVKKGTTAAAETAVTQAPTAARAPNPTTAVKNNGKIVLVPGKGRSFPKIDSPPMPGFNAPKGGPLVYQPRARTGEIVPYDPTIHSGGAMVRANEPQVLPWGYRKAALQLDGQRMLPPGRQLQLPPASGNASQRLLPPGVDPFIPQPSVVRPRPVDIDFSSGGAIVVRPSSALDTPRSPIVTLGSDVKRLPPGAGVDAQATIQRNLVADEAGNVRTQVVFQANGSPVEVTRAAPPVNLGRANIEVQGPVNLGKANLEEAAPPLLKPGREYAQPGPRIRAEVVTEYNAGGGAVVGQRKFIANGGEVARNTVRSTREEADNAARAAENAFREAEHIVKQAPVQMTATLESQRVLPPGSVVDVTPANLPNVRIVAQAVPENVPPSFVTSQTAPGVFADVADTERANLARLARINARKQAAEVAAKVPSSPVNASVPANIPNPLAEPVRITVPTPVNPDSFITAEALSPSLSSADIVRQLTSDTPIVGATYNPKLVLKGERSLASVVKLARSVELPGGVKILQDALSDATISNFSRLAKKVDSAIIAAGLNPSDAEVAGLRRLFQKNGAPLPTNLADDFSIRVQGRRIDTPASFVKPNAGDASGYTPRYPLSDDYGLAVKVKADKHGNIVPSTQADDVVKILQQPGVIGERAFKSYTPAERAGIVAKAARDGDTAPSSIQRAADDVIDPAVGRGDSVATEAYAKQNLPKDIVPSKPTTVTDNLLAKRSAAQQQLESVNNELADATRQMTEIETNLDKALAHIDTLPDIGKVPTDFTKEVVPYTRVPKDASKQVVQSIDNAIDKSAAVTDPEVLRRATDARAATRVDKKTGLVKSYDPDQVNLPAGTTVQQALDAGIVGRTENEILDRYALTFKAGAKGRPLSVKSANGVVINGDAYSSGAKGSISKVEKAATPGTRVLVPRVVDLDAPYVNTKPGNQYYRPDGPVAAVPKAERVRRVGSRGKANVPAKATDIPVKVPATPDVPNPTGAVEHAAEYLHGTRNATLDLSTADPLQGASRSEYGTGLWLTADEGVAMTAASRGVPENLPGGVIGRVMGDSAYVHTVSGKSLDKLNIIKNTATLQRDTLHDIVDSILDNVDEEWTDLLTDRLRGYIYKTSNVTPAKLFSKLDEFTAEATQAMYRQRPTEEEMTLVQRIATDILHASGIDGVMNGKGVALYGKGNITSTAVHDVSDMVASAPAAHALEEVNLLARMAEAEPDSSLLKVQLAEARARAANYIKQDVTDDLDMLQKAQAKHVSEMLDTDEALEAVAREGKAAKVEAAQKAERKVFETFKKEMGDDFTSGCL